MTNHKHYQAAYRAHYATSFSPEKRAKSECKFYDEILAEFEQLGVNEGGKNKFERLFSIMLSAKSRCMSSMITGPSNFPVERARKANERERRVSDELLSYIERVRKAIDKEKNPENHAISSDDENAIDKLKIKLEKMKKAQEQMKACNLVIRDKKCITNDKVKKLADILGSKEKAAELLKGDFCGRIGFPSFALTNNNANIKSTESRIAELEKAATRKTREIIVAGVRVVENAEENRIQFCFEGKPDQEIINLMKSHGFKWSPRQSCWQRLWNNNAIYTINHFIAPKLKELQLSN